MLTKTPLCSSLLPPLAYPYNTSRQQGDRLRWQRRGGDSGGGHGYIYCSRCPCDGCCLDHWTHNTCCWGRGSCWWSTTLRVNKTATWQTNAASGDPSMERTVSCTIGLPLQHPIPSDPGQKQTVTLARSRVRRLSFSSAVTIEEYNPSMLPPLLEG